MAKKGSASSGGTPLNNLRKALLQLKPAGSDGFEGLLAVILGKIAQQDFRLAKSGLQHGKDGETLSSANHISFEGKRYDAAIPNNEVHSKITQLIGSATPPDLWVLGATVEAGTQMLEPMQAAATKNGIGILVLDWPTSSPLPPLALACASAPDETVAFLRNHLTDTAAVSEATAALAQLQTLEGFSDAAAGLAKQLREPSLGGPNARTANGRWLDAAFADRLRAKAVFGQVLAPKAPGPLPTQERKQLTQKVQAGIAGNRAGEIIALIGREGHGKSWLFAQSLDGLSERPTTVVIRAAEVKSVAPYGSILPFLISKFIEQTGDTETEGARRRWERQIGASGPRQEGEAPRFIVCVDGLNEQPDLDWPRLLDSISVLAKQHGGVLVVTAREAYFKDRVRTALLSAVEVIDVPEWSPGELREILSERGIDHSKLAASVFEFLRNPRILGIAFELLDNVEIETFTELTVERLLFEHIRIGAREGNSPEPADQFAKRLAEHAGEIVARVRQQQHEDRLIFEQTVGQGQGYELTPELLAVTAEHFFQPLADDPTLYTLSNEGLSLALGISVMKALQKAERNQRDLAEAMGELIDPIGALDKTAEAVFSAVLVSSIDERCSTSVRRTLIAGLLRLQNLDVAHYPAFVAVVRNAPEAAMLALFDLSVGDDYVANRDWLLSALRECRHRADCWAVMSAHISQWLGSYSVDPGVAMWRRRRDDEAAFVDDLEKKTVELKERWQALSPAELAFVEAKMIRRESFDPGGLYRPALELLAGMPLTPFAEALVAYAWASSFNSSMASPYQEFHALVRFNRSDWHSSRKALLDAAAFLRADDASRTAKWALVSILRATTTAQDAEEEEQLVELLTADREKYPAWRRIETYCASDPCDPDSASPENIDDTAAAYEQIDVDEIAKTRFTGSSDHFLRDGLFGLARFRPETAVAVHRRAAASIIDRTSLEQKIGIASLEDNCAVLDAPTVAKLKELAVEYALPFVQDSKESRDAWFISQYATLLAMPHLDGDAQVDLLLALPPHGAPLTKLADVFKPCSPEKAERLLDAAIQSGESARKIFALSYVHGSGVEVTPRARLLVGQLRSDNSSPVRALAMAVAGQQDDREAMQQLVQSGWSAAALDAREQYYEVWYGSVLLIDAAKNGLIGEAEVLDRISPKLYSLAASALGPAAHGRLAAILKRSVELLLNVTIPFRPPHVEQEVAEAGAERPPLYSLAEPDEVLGAEAFFKKLSETPEDFDTRQREGWKSFEQFENQLTKQQARLAIENVGFDAIDACVSAAPEDAAALAALILKQSDRDLGTVENIGLMLARSLSSRSPALASGLFGHLSGKRAFIGLTFGPSAVPLEPICIWGSANSPELDALRTLRLDRAENDYALGQEVLAALRQHRSDFLDVYARTKLESEQPAEIGRGLMVLGLGLESAFADETLSRYATAAGLIGKAAEAARFAYSRNRWARHWFGLMCVTDSATEFWRLSALFLKVVDGRFPFWRRDTAQTGTAIQSFGASVEGRLEKRISSWKSKREKTLLGDKAPAEIYVVLH